MNTLPLRPASLALFIALFLSGAWAGCSGQHPQASRAPTSSERSDASNASGERLRILPTQDPAIDLRLVFAVGSASDPKGKEGVTRLLASLMVQGGAGKRTYAEIESTLFAMAAELDVQVDRDQTVFTARVHRDHFASFFELFRDVLLAPRLSEDDFGRVKEHQLADLTLELRGNDDEELGKELLQSMLYEGHPYGHPTAGTERGLNAVSRQDVVAQKAALCRPRATLAITGDIPPNFQHQLTTKLMGRLPSSCPVRPTVNLVSPRSARVWIADKPEATATAISMGVPIKVDRAHPDYPALVLAAAYLGQHRQFVGVLVRKIRELRGLNYGDYVYAEHFEQDGETPFPLPQVARHHQYFSVWLRPLQPDKAHFALRLALLELRRVLDQGISQRDFERVRTFASGYYALYLQTESRRLGFALDDTFYGVTQPYIVRLREAWQRLDAKQVTLALKRHIDLSKLQIAIVAPNAKQLADRLATEAPSTIHYDSPVPASVTEDDRDVESVRLGITPQRITVIRVAETFAGN